MDVLVKGQCGRNPIMLVLGIELRMSVLISWCVYPLGHLIHPQLSFFFIFLNFFKNINHYVALEPVT